MFQNYLRTALRTLRNNKAFSTINVIGLSVGIASFIIIGLFVCHELSYDSYHTKADRIYRIVEDVRTETELIRQACSAPPMGPAFAREFPEVEAFVRFSQTPMTVRKGDNFFFEEDCFFADSSIFKVFTFEWIKGNPGSALRSPMTVVLTETMAIKYFGNEEALGKFLEMDGELFEVTGVMGDVPKTSHFSFDILISYSTWSTKNRSAEEGWFWNEFYTYLLLREDTELGRLRDKIPAMIHKYMGKERKVRYENLELQPLTSIYLASPREWENGKRGSLGNVRSLSVIALFILLIAVFNYINLSTSQATKRIKEVGLRKVLGAERKHLIKQFLGESIAISFFSTIVGITLVFIFLPTYNNLLGAEITLEVFDNVIFWLLLMGLIIVLGILSGSYPAFLVSGFHPLLMFKGTPRMFFSSITIRKLLVGAQFVISISILSGTMLVRDQLFLLQNKNLGFDNDQMLLIDFNGSPEVQEHFFSVKNQLEQIPGIKSVSASSTVPGESIPRFFYSIETEEGKMSASTINTFNVDHQLISNYNISIIAGRSFSKDFPADDTTAFILNEAAVRNFGWVSPEMAIGRKIKGSEKQGKIVGVVKDFHYQSLHHGIEPLIIQIDPKSFRVLSCRLQSEDIRDLIATVEDHWKSIAPGVPFIYSFMDQNQERLYKAEDQLGKVVSLFSGLSIFLSCLGLLGLTTFSVERKIKEIGIRKALGARVLNIIYIFSSEVIRLVLVSSLLAIPITYFVIHAWLEGFNERITINPFVFIFVGLSVLAVAILTIGAFTIKAASVNPVKSLRN